MHDPRPHREPVPLPDDDRLADAPLQSDGSLLPLSGRRVSDESNVHDEGSDANDTLDGLTEREEAVRHAAEDIPTGQDPAGPTEAVPVFDRGSLPPKV